jgi:hypothetical protein
METGKRILVAVAVVLLLTIAATGCDDAARAGGQLAKHGIDKVLEVYTGIPKPIKKALVKMGTHEAKDVISASCEVKASSNIEQEARQKYGNLGDYKIGLIVDLAKAMQARPGVAALCSENL